MKYSLIGVDAGHCCSPDIGANGNGVQEDDITDYVGKRLVQKLVANGQRAVIVNPNRCSSVRDSLRGRVDNANDARVGLYVSIHCNSAANSKAKGSEVFYHEGNERTRELAGLISSELSELLDTNNRGAKVGRYFVLRETNMDAILIELGFLSNAIEAKAIKDKQDAIVDTLANVLLEFNFDNWTKPNRDVKSGVSEDWLPLEHEHINETIDYTPVNKPIETK